MTKQEYEDQEIEKMEFVLKEDEFYDQKIIFRFFPKKSHCYGHQYPITNWDDVYKVYYSWEIVCEHDEFGEELLFDMSWDEDSILTDLSRCIQRCIECGKGMKFLTGLGDPTSEWNINIDGAKYEFIVWKDPVNLGYRFILTKDKAEEFAKFIEEINQYMLEHGNPI